MDPQSDKLDALSERIRHAEAEADAKSEPKVRQDTTRNAGFDFAGAVIGAGVIGLLLDRAFGTGPLCLLGMVLFGFVAGIVSAWRAMQKPDDGE